MAKNLLYVSKIELFCLFKLFNLYTYFIVLKCIILNEYTEFLNIVQTPNEIEKISKKIKDACQWQASDHELLILTSFNIVNVKTLEVEPILCFWFPVSQALFHFF